jgi:hypothetical protein
MPRFLDNIIQSRIQNKHETKIQSKRPDSSKEIQSTRIIQKQNGPKENEMK